MTDFLQPPAELPDWARGRINLASPRLGTEARACSDDFFAPVARMLADAPALSRPGVYDENGKWMDGWESRRRRNAGHDWCVIRLGCLGRIAGVDIDTAHFTGNYPKAASVWAAATVGEPGEGDWVEVLPATALGPSAHHLLPVSAAGPWRWVRLNIFPDGGVGRFRVYGDPVAEPSGGGLVELSALTQGGRLVGYNDAHYGDVWAVLSAGRGVNTGDGWETRRRREPGHDWLIVALGSRGVVERIEIDTCHFKGNFPESASVAAADVRFGTDESVVTQAIFWPEILSRQTLQPDHLHVFDLAPAVPVSHVRLNIFPDGGISRLRIWGRVA